MMEKRIMYQIFMIHLEYLYCQDCLPLHDSFGCFVLITIYRYDPWQQNLIGLIKEALLSVHFVKKPP